MFYLWQRRPRWRTWTVVDRLLDPEMLRERRLRELGGGEFLITSDNDAGAGRPAAGRGPQFTTPAASNRRRAARGNTRVPPVAATARRVPVDVGLRVRHGRGS